ELAGIVTLDLKVSAPELARGVGAPTCDLSVGVAAFEDDAVVLTRRSTGEVRDGAAQRADAGAGGVAAVADRTFTAGAATHGIEAADLLVAGDRLGTSAADHLAGPRGAAALGGRTCATDLAADRIRAAHQAIARGVARALDGNLVVHQRGGPRAIATGLAVGTQQRDRQAGDGVVVGGLGDRDSDVEHPRAGVGDGTRRRRDVDLEPALDSVDGDGSA